MKWTLLELQEIASNGYRQTFLPDLSESLKERTTEILDSKNLQVEAFLLYDADTVVADIQVNGILTLHSSRSLEPVDYPIDFHFTERYVGPDARGEFADDGLEIIIDLEDNTVDLAQAVEDHILLNLPATVLTEAEASGQSMPEGKDWQVISEEERRESASSNSPFNDPRLETLLTQLNEQESKTNNNSDQEV